MAFLLNFVYDEKAPTRLQFYKEVERNCIVVYSDGLFSRPFVPMFTNVFSGQSVES